MGRKFTVSYVERLAGIEKYLRNECSMRDLSKQLKVATTTIIRWLARYESLGPEGLQEVSRNQSYSSELKEAAVLDYQSGAYSQRELCKKYNIKSTRQLYDWVFKYNGHEKLKSSGTGGVPIMTKGRKTTYEERIEIVTYCIEHQNNYAETAQKYQVSYQQVYSWKAKYEADGIDGLQDKRGNRKSIDKISETEKLKAQNKLLEAELKRSQMEIAFLKKLEEIERLTIKSQAWN